MFRKFFQSDLASAFCLFIAMVVAMAWANSPWSHSYHDFVHFPMGLYLGHFHLEETLHFWVNDGLMALFFFVVSREIKKEMTVGELSTPKRAALPMIAALGGMVVPGLIYAFFNPTGAAASGWGIPMATDIAFSLGVLALLGDRVSSALKVFLLTLAVADDLGGIIVIAFFYTQQLKLVGLFAAIAFWGCAWLLNKMGIKNILPYIVLGVGAWFSLLFSGVHTTISGVVLALVAPTFSSPKNVVKPFVDFFVLPLFAFLNTGIVLATQNLSEIFLHPVFLGVSLGLVCGKPIGIFLSTWIAVKLKFGDLPRGVDFSQILSVGFIAGIGFTVATFMSHLALADAPTLEVYAKMGILVASIAAAILGAAVTKR